MAYEITVETVEPLRLAAVRVYSRVEDLPIVVPSAFDRLYLMLSGVAGAVLGRNAAFFPDGAGLMTEEGAPVEVGVEMKSVFALPDGLIATKTPAGSAARVTHWGAYNKLPDAHQALHRHCARHEWRITGVNWEVYGDWSDEPAKVRTDIYYQLV